MAATAASAPAAAAAVVDDSDQGPWWLGASYDELDAPTKKQFKRKAKFYKAAMQLEVLHHTRYEASRLDCFACCR